MVMRKTLKLSNDNNDDDNNTTPEKKIKEFHLTDSSNAKRFYNAYLQMK